MQVGVSVWILTGERVDSDSDDPIDAQASVIQTVLELQAQVATLTDRVQNLEAQLAAVAGTDVTLVHSDKDKSKNKAKGKGKAKGKDNAKGKGKGKDKNKSKSKSKSKSKKSKSK